MKKLIILLLMSGAALGQTVTADFKGFPLTRGLASLSFDTCGIWTNKQVEGEWVTINAPKDTAMITRGFQWVYSDKTTTSQAYIHAVYCPCGCRGNDYIITQYRICKITGLHQKQETKVTQVYVPKPKNAYEKALDSFGIPHPSPPKSDGWPRFDSPTMLTPATIKL